MEAGGVLELAERYMEVPPFQFIVNNRDRWLLCVEVAGLVFEVGESVSKHMLNLYALG
jgi:hypothetical protein